MNAEILLLNYVYPELILGIIVITELYKHLFPNRLHPKWLTLLFAVAGALLEVAFRPEPVNIWYLVISFGVAVLGYDYFYKPIKDKVSTNRNQ